MERKIPLGKPESRWVKTQMPSDAPWNYADRRAGEQRFVYDRRGLIRFENDRRASKERRLGVDPWAIP